MPRESQARFAGFGISGFRGARSDVCLRITPGVNFLAGPNNSGKSTLISAIKQYLEPLHERVKNGGSYDFLSHSSDFDRPHVGGRVDPAQTPLAVGVGISLPATDPEEAWLRLLLGDDVALQLSDPDIAAVGGLLSGIRDSEGVHWLWLERGNSDGQHIFAVPQRHTPSDAVLNAYMQVAGRLRVPGENGWITHVRVALGNLPDLPERVVVIEGQRTISGATNTGLRADSTNGGDVISVLLTIQAPLTEQYAESRERRDLINDFVRQVLNDPEAELVAAHDRSRLSVALNGQLLPLQNLGSGTAQVIALAVLILSNTGSLICVEEPEVFLHPALQRLLIDYLASLADERILLATHSAAMLDRGLGPITAIANDQRDGVTVSSVVSTVQAALLVQNLGYRASDLLQANAVIWIEGPSDRLYINQWLSKVDDDLIEGVHFNYVIYGGALATELTAADSGVPSDGPGVDMFKINRNSVLVIDADSADGSLSPTKQRLRSEFQAAQVGHCWVTEGYTIENYADVEALRSAMVTVHPDAGPRWTFSGGCENPFNHEVFDGPKYPKKVPIALAYVALDPPIPVHLSSLAREMDVLVEAIRGANEGLAAPSGVAHETA